MKSYSGKAFCKVLEKHGWILIRVNGSHHVYRKKGNNFAISVPVHSNQDLKIGTLKSIMKQANLTEEDLI